MVRLLNTWNSRSWSSHLLSDCHYPQNSENICSKSLSENHGSKNNKLVLSNLILFLILILNQSFTGSPHSNYWSPLRMNSCKNLMSNAHPVWSPWYFRLYKYPFITIQLFLRHFRQMTKCVVAQHCSGVVTVLLSIAPSQSRCKQDIGPPNLDISDPL